MRETQEVGNALACDEDGPKFNIHRDMLDYIRERFEHINIVARYILFI